MQAELINNSALDNLVFETAVEGVSQITRHLVMLLRANEYAESCISTTILDAFQHAWYQEYQTPTDYLRTLADLYGGVLQRFQVDLSDEGEWYKLESAMLRELF